MRAGSLHQPHKMASFPPPRRRERERERDDSPLRVNYVLIGYPGDGYTAEISIRHSDIVTGQCGLEL